MSGPLKGREAQTVASGQVALSAGLVLITIRVYHVQSELPRPNYGRTLVCGCWSPPKEGMSNSHPAQQAGGLVLNEAQTRFELIDPALARCGWQPGSDIKVEETAAPVDIIYGKGKRRPKGRTDYVLRRRLTTDGEPIPLAILEAKREGLPAEHGLQQGK